jgi:O-acetyl-ADP-ribose deacetylase (regulator of RNase III)
MIEYKTSDILREEVEALVNTVNCVGVMGRGIALQFKNAFPENFKAYEKACKRGEVQPGRMFVYDYEKMTFPRYIINFPTKRHWRGKSLMEDIEKGLEALVDEIQNRDIQSIAVPPLGCGLGGLNWGKVRQKIEDYLAQLSNVQIVIFEPKGAPEAVKMTHIKEAPRMTPGRAALVGLMQRYLSGLLDPFVTLLEIHKLMYFLQEAGEPLQLDYKKGPYGPYAEKLRHILNSVEGHLISGYADGGDSPKKQLKLVPGAVDDAKKFLQDYPDTNRRFERVSDLVDGFETPFGLELLATIHWVIKESPVKNLEDIVSYTYRWNDRKKQFSPRQIEIATRILKEKEWLEDHAIQGIT